VRIFGDDSAAADRVAEALGRALQLTNILRDLAEDAGRGRLYLPRELLAAHGIATSEPGTVLAHPALPAVCRDLAGVTARYYDEADAAMAESSRRAMRPAAVMSAVYRATFDRLVAGNWQDLEHPPKASTFTKLWLVARHGFF
jgi:phytoene synthase